PNVEEVTEGLRQLLERTDSERATLGAVGRALVERDYTWDRQARRLAEIYGWVCNGGSPPDFVRDAEDWD
ncbi:glycosyltransferase, partial [Singulisphaera rosea]